MLGCCCDVIFCVKSGNLPSMTSESLGREPDRRGLIHAYPVPCQSGLR